MWDSAAIRRAILGIAATGVIAAGVALQLDLCTPARAPRVDSEQLQRARESYWRQQEALRAAEEEARRLAEAEALRVAAMRDGAPRVTESEDSEPVLGPDGLPDRGPPFDPYNLPMTGDRAYDMSTRRSAAHRLYGQQDYGAALALAREVLAESPDDVRTHLLVVLTACAMGDEELARVHRQRLPENDRARADEPCARAGIVLADRDLP